MAKALVWIVMVALLFIGTPAIAQVNDCTVKFGIGLPQRYIVDGNCSSTAGGNIPAGLPIVYDINYREKGATAWTPLPTVTASTSSPTLAYTSPGLPCGKELEFTVTSHWVGEAGICTTPIATFSTVRSPPGRPTIIP